MNTPLPLGDRMRDVNPVIVAHGTRNPHGVNMIAEIAAAVSERIGTTRTAFVDVLGPTPAEVLSDLADDRPAVVVPAFLASGYHVRQDLPGYVAESGRPGTIVTRALGPDRELWQQVARKALQLYRKTHGDRVPAGWVPGPSRG